MLSYYAWLPDSEDLNRVKEYVEEIAKKAGLQAYLALSDDNTPVTSIIGKCRNGVFVKKCYYLEDFEDFVRNFVS